MFVRPASLSLTRPSLPWIGKISGCFGAEPIIEKLGFKKTMYVVAAIQCIAIIGELESGCLLSPTDIPPVELTATTWEQFTVGRIIAYFAVGIVENGIFDII